MPNITLSFYFLSFGADVTRSYKLILIQKKGQPIALTIGCNHYGLPGYLTMVFTCARTCGRKFSTSFPPSRAFATETACTHALYPEIFIRMLRGIGLLLVSLILM